MAKRPTIAMLESQVANLRASSAMNYETGQKWKEQADQNEKALKESREHFADLKQRLLAAEQANQFMRGYLARVQEDDTVREELLTVGDPAGEQHMVPKRKPTHFERPNDFTEPRSRGGVYGDFGEDSRRDRKPRHWISY